MAWNQPGKNGQDRDPWGGRSGNSGNSGGNKKGDRHSGPSDLDDLFRKWKKRILGKKGHQSGSQYPNGRFIGLIILAVLIIWIGSGFYTVKETDLGVVTRFGKYSHLVKPGLNWKPTFIDQVREVNVETTKELATSGVMLTADENVVQVEMNVQYRVTDPVQYLYSVTNPDDSLRQATDSALRAVVGKYSMDKILTEGRTVVRSDTQAELINTIKVYNMGITIQDVNFQAARPPKQVQAAFDDAIAARENEQQYIRQAEAYANEVQPKANGKAQRLLENAKAYRARVTLIAQGEVERFSRLLPEYKQAPAVMRERMYLDAMQNILEHTHNIVIDDKGSNVVVLPLDQLLQGKSKGRTVATTKAEQSAKDDKTSATHDTKKDPSVAVTKTDKTETDTELSAVNSSSSTANSADIYELRRNNARFGGN